MGTQQALPNLRQIGPGVGDFYLDNIQTNRKIEITTLDLN